jgi:hypothetical protein
MTKTRIPDPHTIARVAVEAQCDAKTVRSYFVALASGERPTTRPSIRARIESAIERIARGKVR